MKVNQPRILPCACVILTGLIVSSPALSQIIPDTTLPVNSVVTPGCTQCVISGGTQAGANLFHSFINFSIPTGGFALFNNDLQIQNIIARVTGVNQTTIDGLLRSSGSSNLFLINPNGISFGTNARLNLGGSFVATSANQVFFPDGRIFAADPNSTSPLFSSSVPVGLGFLNPGPIELTGSGHTLISQTFVAPIIGVGTNLNGLNVRPGRTIALIGGQTTLNGGVINAPSGHIEIAGVNEGLVALSPTTTGFQFNYQASQGFQNVTLTNRALTDATGFGLGSIGIQGQNIKIDRGSVVVAQNAGNRPNGDFLINAAESLTISGTDAIARLPSGIYNFTLGRGTGGNIRISSPQITIKEGGIVTTGTGLGSQPAGQISVNASDFLEVNGISPRDGRVQSTIVSYTVGPGNSGDININAGRVRVLDGAFINSATYSFQKTAGNGGSVNINAEQSIEVIGSAQDIQQFSLIGSSALGSGNAGNVTLNTSTLTILNGGRIDSSTITRGNSGSVFINAPRSVIISGTASNSSDSSTIASSADILNPNLAAFYGIRETPTGSAGSIIINTENLTLSNRGQLTVQNKGTGNAGTLSLSTRNLRILSQGSITAETRSGEGGNIEVTASDLTYLNNGTITASARRAGSGGNILINTNFGVLINGSRISANAEQSNGGKVTINALGIFSSQDSTITATSLLGPEFNGIVVLNTPNTNLTSSVLKPDIVPESPQIADVCASQSQSAVSSFTNEGTGGIPVVPQDLFSSSAPWQDNEAQLTEQSLQPQTNTSPPTTIVEAQGWRRNSNNTVSLTTVPATTLAYSSVSQKCGQP